MDIKFLTLGEYSQYVWPAFIFSFTICLSFYVSTKRKLEEMENVYKNEFKENKNIEVLSQKIKVRHEVLASITN